MKNYFFRLLYVFFIIFIVSTVLGAEDVKSRFTKNSIELSGVISVGKSHTIFVSDKGKNDYYGSRQQLTKQWYMDISPVVSYYFTDNWFVYASPAFSLSSAYNESSALYRYKAGYLIESSNYSEADTIIGYVPYLGLGHVLPCTETFFLSIAVDMQQRWSMFFSKEAGYEYSLARFNLRVTPKILLGESIFLNTGLIVYYETNRVHAPWQNKLPYPIEGWGINLQAGLSWVF